MRLDQSRAAHPSLESPDLNKYLCVYIVVVHIHTLVNYIHVPDILLELTSLPLRQEGTSCDAICMSEYKSLVRWCARMEVIKTDMITLTAYKTVICDKVVGGSRWRSGFNERNMSRALSKSLAGTNLKIS